MIRVLLPRKPETMSTAVLFPIQYFIASGSGQKGSGSAGSTRWATWACESANGPWASGWSPAGLRFQQRCRDGPASARSSGPRHRLPATGTSRSAGPWTPPTLQVYSLTVTLCCNTRTLLSNLNQNTCKFSVCCVFFLCL